MHKLLSLIFLIGYSISAYSAGITAIGFVMSDGSTVSSARPVAVSNGGVVAVRTADNVVGYNSAMWTQSGGLEIFLTPSYTNYGPNDISSDGSTIVGRGRYPNTQGYSWRNGSGTTILTGLRSSPHAVSADGSVVAGTVGGEAAIWVNGVEQTIGFLPGGDQSHGHLISADGSVVAGTGRAAGGVFTTFVWTAANGMIDLNLGPGIGSHTVSGMSSDGSMIVGGVGNIPYLWTNGVSAPLGFQGGVDGMSGDGSMIVGKTNDGVILWTQEDGAVLLADYLTANGADLTGWNLMNIYDISENGQWVVGDGNYNGIRQGFIASLTVVPVPAAVYLFGSALLGLGWMRRRA